MATTSIWSVKGWLGKVVLYAENPEKTSAPETADIPEPPGMGETDRQGFSDVIAYAVDGEKTRRRKEAGMGDAELPDEDGGTLQQYVTGINCTPSTARDEMMAAKKRFGKDTGIMAYHGYQSFAPGECSPQTAHEIGVKLAEELWGGRFQVIVATHLDKAHHLHNHFVVNSVSFMDGKRYHRSRQDYRDMREASDRLCRAYRLSVIEHPETGKGKHYGEWRAERDGKPTYRSTVKADIDEAVEMARTEKQFFHYLKEKGYAIKIGKDITVCPQGRERGLKLARNFGEDYTVSAIRRRILEAGKEKPLPRREARGTPAAQGRGNMGHGKRKGGLRRLYLYYCFLLGIFPKQKNPPDMRHLHILLKEDLRKMETISEETRLLCRNRIDTEEQLSAFRESLEKEMAGLADERKHLRYRIRSMKDAGELAEAKEKAAGLTERIGKLRKEAGLCDGIAGRSGILKEKIRTVRTETGPGKEEKEHEHIGRGR